MNAQDLLDRWQQTRQLLVDAAKKAKRDPQSITLVAVSKHQDQALVRTLGEAGQLDFGENYVQEALPKQEALADLGLRWHFIGRLQTNKAKFVAGGFHLVHSVDSLKLARALHNKAQERGGVQPILLQVNLAGERQKGGVDEADLPRLVDAVLQLSGIRLQGLMTMPPFFDDPDRSRPLFARLRKLRDAMQTAGGCKLPHLSMGMTQDCVQAVAEGATLVRIGTRIFGPRARK